MPIRSKTAGEVTKKEVSLKYCFKNWHARGKELCLGGRSPCFFHFYLDLVRLLGRRRTMAGRKKTLLLSLCRELVLTVPKKLLHLPHQSAKHKKPVSRTNRNGYIQNTENPLLFLYSYFFKTTFPFIVGWILQK